MSEIGFGIGTSTEKFFIKDLENDRDIWFYQDALRLPEIEEFQRLMNSDLQDKKVGRESTRFFVDILNARRVDRQNKIDMKVFKLLSSRDLLGIGVLLAAGGLALAENATEEGDIEKK